MEVKEANKISEAGRHQYKNSVCSGDAGTTYLSAHRTHTKCVWNYGDDGYDGVDVYVHRHRPTTKTPMQQNLHAGALT